MVHRVNMETLLSSSPEGLVDDHGRTQACELRDDSRVGAGWDVLVLQDGEP